MKYTSSFITPMIVGQSAQGNSINQSDLDPGTYTLQFSFVAVDPDSGGNEFIPTTQAIINWKIEGQQQRRVISIVSGASISGVATGADVQIVDIPLGGTATVGKAYKVQATLSRGVRGNTQQPPTLTDTPVKSAAAVNGTATFDVPQDSGVTSVFIMCATGGGGTPPTQFQIKAIASDASLPSPATLGTWYPLLTTGWVPLPPGTQRVVVFNGSPDETLFIQAIWGIDG